MPSIDLKHGPPDQSDHRNDEWRADQPQQRAMEMDEPPTELAPGFPPPPHGEALVEQLTEDGRFRLIEIRPVVLQRLDLSESAEIPVRLVKKQIPGPREQPGDRGC